MDRFDEFPAVDGGDEERITDTGYYWDNRKRSETNRINVQRTLEGAAFFENEQGRFIVDVGKVMIFTQRENSRYGYPPTARQPYRHRYISIDPSPILNPLFHKLRNEFGSVILMDPPIQSPLRGIARGRPATLSTRARRATFERHGSGD